MSGIEHTQADGCKASRRRATRAVSADTKACFIKRKFLRGNGAAIAAGAQDNLE
jgi:hypothetical protein